MSDEREDSYRGLGWAHGALTVQRLGAMLAPLTFVFKDGRQVSPMHIAPWAGAPGTEELPGILRRLRGDWSCAPFGYAVHVPDAAPDWKSFLGEPEPGEELHGHSSNAEWDWEESADGTLALHLVYPRESPIARVERRIEPDPNAPAVDIVFTIHIREACRLPIGLHPTFRLPKIAQAARLEPAPFAEGRTYPGTVEPAAPLFAIDQSFSDLAAVPLRSGGTFDATRLPFVDDSEELVQLNGIEGSCALANRAEGYRVRLIWQKEHFPSLLLWYSNRGRKFSPWNGEQVSIGIEPLCSPFGLGPATARADNPIARSGTPTARDFSAGEIFTTRYRIEAEVI
jgi:hypothetical protein